MDRGKDRRMDECNVISMSGGKDSTAMALLAIEQDVPNRHFLFADTGHEHQMTYDYVDYLEDALGITIERVKANFDDKIAHKRTVVDTKWRDDGVPEATIERALELLVPTGNPFLDLCLWKGRFPSTRRRFCSEELEQQLASLRELWSQWPELNEITIEPWEDDMNTLLGKAQEGYRDE